MTMGRAPASAYIFVRNGESWIQQVKLTPDDGATSDNFGQSVSISEDVAIVGAPQARSGGTQTVRCCLYLWQKR